MYKIGYLTLIVAGLLVAGFGIFNSPVVQAAAPCVAFSDATLTANPELLKIKCSEVIVQAENDMASNPELSLVQRYDVANSMPGIEANPELGVVYRYNAVNKTADNGFFAFTFRLGR